MNASFTAEEEGAPAQHEKRRRLGKRMVETTGVEGSGSRAHRTVAQVADKATAKAIQLWQNGYIVCRAKGYRTRL